MGDDDNQFPFSKYKLTNKEIIFCQAIIDGLKRKDAVIKAGFKHASDGAYSKKASWLLRQPGVDAYLSFLRQKADSAKIMSESAALEELSKIAQGNGKDHFTKVFVKEDKEGKTISLIKQTDKLKAINRILEHHIAVRKGENVISGGSSNGNRQGASGKVTETLTRRLSEYLRKPTEKQN